MRTGKTWQRRDFFIEDESTKARIQCKLWRELAESVTHENAGSPVSLRNVENKHSKKEEICDSGVRPV
ncbi:hypothetical protein HOLleu_00739 [Holothuria leucospilota]|uniref:Uncharacterized protein n=1 Tax=Holothuria leucospilota TaxID=206669 RepID=A0A9Q1CP16_HOLLE|nr:hypothetical protein HOLleu_00739 [Holothuria leucospilota]